MLGTHHNCLIFSRIEDELKCMGRNRRPASRRVGTKPSGLPFDSVEAICNFEEATDEEYDNLVSMTR